MGYYSSFGRKIGAAANSFGSKFNRTMTKGLKVVAEEAGQVSNIADKVSGVAGTIAAGSAMLGLEPVALAAGAVAAGAKGVEKVSDMAGTASKGVLAAKTAVDFGGAAIDSIRQGNMGLAMKQGKTAVAAGKLAATSVKAIERKRTK